MTDNCRLVSLFCVKGKIVIIVGGPRPSRVYAYSWPTEAMTNTGWLVERPASQPGLIIIVGIAMKWSCLGSSCGTLNGWNAKKSL